MEKKEWKIIKNTTIKEFRERFFSQNEVEKEKYIELFEEFSLFTNSNGEIVEFAIHTEYINLLAKIIAQRFFEKTGIGKSVGNIGLLEVRFKSTEHNLKKLNEGKTDEKKEMTEQDFVTWVVSVAKYFGFEIKQSETSIYDFVIMSRKMISDRDLQKKEFEKNKIRKPLKRR